MPTNREAYFEAINLGVPKPVVDFALCEINDFDYLGLTKTFDDEIKDYSLFKESMERYIKGEMIEYIFNRAYFLQLPLYVDKNVLIPRQETEELVIGAKVMIDKIFEPFSKINIADVCTGSGVIGIYLKRMFKLSTVYLTDIDEECLKVAESNSKMHHLPVNCIQGDLLSPLIEQNIKLDVLVCNPPYIGDKSTIDEQVWKYEPHKALLANPKTEFYERIFKDADKVMKENALLAFEIGEDMEDEICILVENYFPNSAYKLSKDMYGKMRFLFIMIKEDGNYA